MKNVAVAINFCFCASIATAQLKITNRNLVNPDESLLYTGVENHLVVSGQAFTRATSSANAKISLENGGFVVVPASVAGLDTIKVFSGKKLLLTKVYQLEKLTDPVAILAYTTDTLIPVGRILVNPYLSVRSPGSSYKWDINVVFFACDLQLPGGQQLEFKAEGNKLPTDMLAAVKKLGPGNKIHFNMIYVQSPSWGNRKAISPLSITIK